MATQFDADVLICGAGAAGLTLAIDLARHGISFTLIEQTDGPLPGSRGKGLKPRSQEVFEDLGILDRIVAAGGVYPPEREYQPDGSYSEESADDRQEPTPAEPYHIPLMVPQFLTEGVMRDRLIELGHKPRFGWAVESFQQDPDGVTVRITGGGQAGELRVRYLVGTDGGRSTVRHLLGIEFPGETLGVRAVVADVKLVGLDRSAWHRFGEGSMKRQIAICPLVGTELFQVQAPVPLEGDVDVSADGLTRIISDRTGRGDIAVTLVSWASVYSMNARLAARYRADRIFLAGDAAHIHPPTGGQGLNTSVQDVYNLSWKLAAVLGSAPDVLLDSYEEERRLVAAEVLGLSTRLLDETKRGIMKRGREVKQLDLGYAGSSLALASSRLDGVLLAGDRAPDAPILQAAGQPTRLFELFKGPHWTLIGWHTERTQIAPRPGLHIHIIGPGGDLSDDRGHMRDGYGLSSGEWVLVRPDGYIGAIISQKNVDALDSYMTRVGIGRC